MSNVPRFQIRESHGIYAPRHGYFGRADYNNTLMWINCRESFHYYIDDNGRGYDGKSKYRYYFVVYGPDNTMDLVGYVEDRLGIKNKTKFQFQENYNPNSTIRCNVLQVEPAPFWIAQPMRHAFLTCCLKASLNSCGWDHMKTLQQYSYFNSTWNAVLRFIHGDTWYTPDHQGLQVGWLMAFGHRANYHPNLEAILNRPTDANIGGRAYQLWEEAGRPWGGESHFWNMAKEQLLPAG